MSTATRHPARPASDNGFARLLAWLDDGLDSDGERYLEMRRRLLAYFRRRNRSAPDLLADETFDRIARTLDEEGRIRVTPPARYCYVVARYVLLEDVRHARRHLPLDESRRPSPPDDGAAERATRSRALACLECCLDRLQAEDRTLIVEYYRDGKQARIDGRRDLARRLGLSMNALGIRTWRLRAALRTCVGRCGDGAAVRCAHAFAPRPGLGLAG